MKDFFFIEVTKVVYFDFVLADEHFAFVLVVVDFEMLMDLLVFFEELFFYLTLHQLLRNFDVAICRRLCSGLQITIGLYLGITSLCRLSCKMDSICLQIYVAITDLN